MLDASTRTSQTAFCFSSSYKSPSQHHMLQISSLFCGLNLWAVQLQLLRAVQKPVGLKSLSRPGMEMVMESCRRRGWGSVMMWGVLVVVLSSCVHVIPLKVVESKTLPNCSLPSIYAFGDSLTDVGNSIAAFPDQFALAETDGAYGSVWPQHAADRYSDGKLLVDFLEYGFRGTPEYAWLRSIAAKFLNGTNFASAGGSARNTTTWVLNNGFNSPFPLSVQIQWMRRYKIHLYYYDIGSASVTQELPTYDSLNQSLYVMYAGYQDYFFDLYDQKVTPAEGLYTVPDVVAAITAAIEDLVEVGAKMILVVNLPPLGCIPAMLTLYPGSIDQYDSYGCLKELNNITAKHNKILEEKVVTLRTKYTDVKLYYGDVYGVYIDILKDPLKYNVTEPLKAACGYGGKYNFNKQVICGYTGTVNGKFVNLTTTENTTDTAHFLSVDGIHLSNTINKAIATDFFSAKHITPDGGFQCSPDFSIFDRRT